MLLLPSNFASFSWVWNVVWYFEGRKWIPSVENRVVREILEPKRDIVNGNWMILC